MEDPAGDFADAPGIDREQHRERQKEKGGPERGHGAAQKAETPADQHGHGVAEKRVQIVQEVVDRLFDAWIFGQAQPPVLDMLHPLGRQLKIVGLEFAQPRQPGDGLRRHQQGQDGDGHEQAGENGRDIAAERHVVRKPDKKTPSARVRLAALQADAPSTGPLPEAPVKGQGQAGKTGGHEDGDGVGPEQQIPSQRSQKVKQARQKYGHISSLCGARAPFAAPGGLVRR